MTLCRAGPASRRETAGHPATWDVSEQTLQKHHASKQSIMEEWIHLLARSHLLPFTGQASPHTELLPWASRLYLLGKPDPIPGGIRGHLSLDIVGAAQRPQVAESSCFPEPITAETGWSLERI